ncbi:hypothetical protein L6452_17313 [Arctium lappa]|uniref:Uncharacterized protein n=1 Tax=Arctium lappa TaxID=4217 RepID=A0ACB9C2X7_ARCLA|nr:hypothetical protein L6452_17313 [Arctium lappa]
MLMLVMDFGSLLIIKVLAALSPQWFSQNPISLDLFCSRSARRPTVVIFPTVAISDLDLQVDEKRVISRLW